MIYYHGTTSLNAERIKKDGISPNNSKYAGKIYLTTNYGEASKYAKIASDGKPGKVLKIHSDNLNPEHVYSNNSGIIEYKGSIHPNHISEETNVGMIAGSGDSRLPVDQREPGININIKNNKKILRRKKLNLDEDYLNSLSLNELEALVENIDQLDELSGATLGSYIAKAYKDAKKKSDYDKTLSRHPLVDEKYKKVLGSNARRYDAALDDYKETMKKVDPNWEKNTNYKKRYDGIDKAIDKLRRGKFTKEDYNEINGALINTVINESPSDFYNLFSDIIYSKISNYVDSMKEDVAYDLFESGRLNELSGATLGNYIMKARKQIGDTKSKKLELDDYIKNNKRARGIDRAGSKLLGGRTEYGDRVEIKYFKPRTKASFKEDVDQLDELSRELLDRYINKAQERGNAHLMASAQYRKGAYGKVNDYTKAVNAHYADYHFNKALKRGEGIKRAKVRIGSSVKEDSE